MSYYNTTKESGTTLNNKVAKAKSQEEEILSIFVYSYNIRIKNKNDFGFTPSILYDALENYPITSIRRALTNLTKQGKLIKTDEKRIGMYGRSEYVWKLNENN